MPARLPPASEALLRALDCDLVDEEDRAPDWMTTLIDTRNDGPLRDRFRQIAAAVLAPEAEVQAA